MSALFCLVKDLTAEHAESAEFHKFLFSAFSANSAVNKI